MIGRIKIGQKTGDYPTSLDYFKLEGTVPIFTEMARNAYGEKPTAIPILIESLSTGLILKSKGKLIAIGDEDAVRIYKDTGSTVVTPSNFDGFWEKMEQKYNAKWCTWLKLSCILPKIAVIGTWNFFTTGENVIIPTIKQDVSLAGGDTSGLWLLSIYKKHTQGKQFPVVNLNKITNPEVL